MLKNKEILWIEKFLGIACFFHLQRYTTTMTKKASKRDPVKQEEDYVSFLKKRLASKHFLENEPKEEIDKTKRKYEKAKLMLRMLKGELK